jgi:hypothetical protein
MAQKSPARRGRSTSLEGLAPFEDDCVLVVIETPKGSPSKLTFEPRYGTFVLKGVLPAGAVVPFDFGFVPSTRGDDGDPLDVLVLMDAPVYPGCTSPRGSSASSRLRDDRPMVNKSDFHANHSGPTPQPSCWPTWYGSSRAGRVTAEEISNGTTVLFAAGRNDPH